MFTPEEEAQAKKSTTPELDSAGWLRLGQMASFAGQGMAQATPTATNAKQATTVDAPGKKPGLLKLIAADTVRSLQRSWRWVFHPLQSLRQWVADVMQVQSPPDTWGTVPQAGQEAKTSAQTPVTQDAKATTPGLEDTWRQLRDRLFAAAANPQVDPAQAVPTIIAGIPEAHRAVMSERLTAFAEMAQETAKALAAREMAANESGKSQSQAKSNIPKGKEAVPMPDQEPRLKRQVPAQPVAEASKAQRSRVEAEKAKATSPNKGKAAQR